MKLSDIISAIEHCITASSEALDVGDIDSVELIQSRLRELISMIK